MNAMTAINASADIGNVVFILIVLALATLANIALGRASMPRDAMTETAMHECANEYRACIVMGYSARHARANVRAILHTQYKFAPHVKREITKRAIAHALQSIARYEKSLSLAPLPTR